MTTIDLNTLETITGGANRAGCQTPAQFDWMKQHMVPNDMSRPGVQQHVVLNDAKRCGLSMK